MTRGKSEGMESPLQYNLLDELGGACESLDVLTKQCASMSFHIGRCWVLVNVSMTCGKCEDMESPLQYNLLDELGGACASLDVLTKQTKSVNLVAGDSIRSV